LQADQLPRELLYPIDVTAAPSNVDPHVAAFGPTQARKRLREHRDATLPLRIIEYRSADGQYDRLPALAAELVRRHVNVIVTLGGVPAALAAKSATATIPIVFQSGADPVKMGLVASLAQPGGNMTGASNLDVEIGPKQMEMLHELVPMATSIALLVNPTNPNTETVTKDMQTAARILGLQLHIVNASANDDLDTAFANLIRLPAGGLVIAPDPFFGRCTGDTSRGAHNLLRRGLGDIGYAEGRNVAIEYRFTDGRYDRVSADLTDLTQRKDKVGVIVLAGSGLSEGLLQQACASPIPIVLISGPDPVRLGLVASMNRPGGNVTGVSVLTGELSGKQLGLLHDLVPKAATIAALVDPRQASRETIIRDARDAAVALGQKLLVLEASTAEEIDAQFASLDQKPADAMLMTTSPFFIIRVEQIAALAARHRIPAIYVRREYAEAGGLMSYGYNVAESYRDLGRYAGRILNGEKPAGLPIIQATKYELVINLRTAKAINFEFPPLMRLPTR
jgi:putative ABC transport system substrate-binding protein